MFLLIVIVAFFFVGLYLFFSGLFPIKIEISHYFSDESIAKIHKKSTLPPFKDIEITVRNLKQAIIGTHIDTRHTKRGRSYQVYTYRVELESSDGTIVPVTNMYDGNYASKQQLSFKINESIKEKTPFEYTISQSVQSVVGVCLIVVALIFFFGFFLKL
jgi:hypothetical protein